MPKRQDPRRQEPEAPKFREGEVGTERSRPRERHAGDPPKCPHCNSRTFTHRAGEFEMDEKGWFKTVETVCSNGHSVRKSREAMGQARGDGRPFDGAW